MAGCKGEDMSVTSTTKDDVENGSSALEIYVKKQPSSQSYSPSQTTPSSVSGSINTLSTEDRLKRLKGAEQLKTEQRLAKLLESQRHAEEKLERQKEERKRRIEESRLRNEASIRLATERRKELEKTKQEHLLSLAERSRTRATSVSEPGSHSRGVSALMHISQTLARCRPEDQEDHPNVNRMCTSFTVAFGSAAPRSICTKISDAVLRSQAAFEARLASYLNGRHSGCFLTSSSPYTTYARYVNPSLLPPNHPIHNLILEHHQHQGAAAGCHQVVGEFKSTKTASRRAASANPAFGTIDANRIHHVKPKTKTVATSSKVAAKDSSTTSLNRQGQHVSRFSRAISARRAPTHQMAGINGDEPGEVTREIPKVRRELSQHFAAPTISFASKQKGAAIEIPLRSQRSKPVSAVANDVRAPQRREAAGRSNVPREHSNSYAAPTTASASRQRDFSQDCSKTPPITTAPVLIKKSSAPGAVTRGRSQLRNAQKVAPSANSKQKSAANEASTVRPFKEAAPSTPKNFEISTDGLDSGVAGSELNQQKLEESPDKSTTDTPSAVASIHSAQRPLKATPPHSGTFSLTDELSFAQNSLDNTMADDEPSEATESELPVAAFTSPKKRELNMDSGIPSLDTESEFAPEKTGEVASSNTLIMSVPASESSQDPIETQVIDIASVQLEIQPPAVSHTEPAQVVTAPPSVVSAAPIAISTTGAGEGGCLPENEANLYRAKMAEQRRLAKERKAEEEKRQIREREHARQAAQERAVEEARLLREARLAAEAQAIQEAEMQRQRETSAAAAVESTGGDPTSIDSPIASDEKVARDRERLKALERHRLETLRREEDERAKRKKQLESIMSRVKGNSGTSLSRTNTANSSTHSLSAMTTSLTAESKSPFDQPSTTAGLEDGHVQFTVGGIEEPRGSVFSSSQYQTRLSGADADAVTITTNGHLPTRTNLTMGNDANGLDCRGYTAVSKSTLSPGSDFKSPLLQSIIGRSRLPASNSQLEESQLLSSTPMNAHDFRSTSLGAVAGGTNGSIE